ncbi:hypothetical protein PF008_g11593 [Phytophthora fragariae]|uniref:Uncharacterized protein n=1 Tax=Phytophthora fragariae TaxID=53985 RepID=A0A6G0RQC7_9STRA|nr:hypothetical protein PF008_g11593 [Phytophthora fragariae]
MMSRIVFSVWVVVLLSCHCIDAEDSDSVLTFWDGANFTGDAVQTRRTFVGQMCYNKDVGKPSSITWKNLPTSGLFEGKSKIAFYSGQLCGGIVRAGFTTEKDFPTNLTLDKLNNGIQSFMLWQINKQPRLYKNLGAI